MDSEELFLFDPLHPTMARTANDELQAQDTFDSPATAKDTSSEHKRAPHEQLTLHADYEVKFELPKYNKGTDFYSFISSPLDLLTGHT